MQKAINELKEKLDILEKEELNDIVSLAMDTLVHATASSNSPYSELSRRMENHKDYESIKSKSIRETIDMNNREGVINNLNKYSPNLYDLCLKTVHRENYERSHTISVLIELIERLSKPLEKEILELSALKKIFNYINISTNSQITIFLYIIKNNALIHSIFKKNVCIPNLTELINHKYQYITIEEVALLLVEQRLEEFFNDENPKNPLGQQELQDFFEATCIDCKENQETCQKLNSIFSKNIWDLKESDYQEVMNLMNTLSIGDIGYRINKQISKQASEYTKVSKIDNIIGITSYDVIFKHDSLPKVKINIPKKEIKEEIKEIIKPKYSQRKINQVHYEISKLYSLEHFKAKETLSLDEIIYLLSLMYSIEMDDEVIKKFLSSVMSTYYKSNPISIFYQSYDKFKSIDDQKVQEHLEMIEYILSENNIFLCSDEEYQEVKELIDIELSAIIDIISHNYDYEIKKAKGLLNRKKET